ncbi:hypothetical protein EON65_22235, partial [archaeon]
MSIQPRYLRDEDLSIVNETGEVILDTTTSHTSSSAKPGQKKGRGRAGDTSNMHIAWIDPTLPYIQRNYPALYEALGLLTTLPFELNRQGGKHGDNTNRNDSMGMGMDIDGNRVGVRMQGDNNKTHILKLLEPLRGSCMFVYYPPGCTQKMRLDCRTDIPRGDSGIRITSAYHIHTHTPNP